MKVFRLCDSNEVENITTYRDFNMVGKECKNDPTKNTHNYIEGEKYMHFFTTETDILYISPTKGDNICIYDIPDEVLNQHSGFGNYPDFVFLRKMKKIPEFAIPSKKMKIDYLKQIYLITNDMEYDYFPEKEELYDSMSCIIDLPGAGNRVKDDDMER